MLDKAQPSGGSPALDPLFFRAFSQSTADGILILDTKHEPIFYNEKYLELWQLSVADMQPENGLKRRKLMSDLAVSPEVFYAQIDSVVRNPLLTLRTEVRLKSEAIYDCHIAPVHDERGKYRGQLVTYRDITAHRFAETQRNFLDAHDKVTGLLNRTAMFNLAEVALASAEAKSTSLSVLVFDLTKYKNINNYFGHIVGDTVLGKIGNLLRKRLKMHSLSRHGEDEFMLLIEGQQETSIEEIVDTISASLQEVTVPDGPHLELTASYGASTFPQHGATVTQLVANADIAMRHAQQKGPGTLVTFSADLGERAAKVMDIQTQLPNALENNCFRLVYQPLVDIETQQIVGSEALIRWECEDLGDVPPNIFLPHAEESGLIIQIGEWVLKSACMQVKLWEQLGLGRLPVSVNVSAIQFSGSDFAQTVENALCDSNLDPQLLEIELTETAFAQHLAEVSKAIDRIRALGVRVSIDDFGTGYSSLKYLRHFKVDTLKIDGAFTQGIGITETDNALVTTAINMAHNLGLNATAEGVENAEQLNFLKENKCDLAQGYFFSKPISPGAFSQLLKETKSKKAAHPLSKH